MGSVASICLQEADGMRQKGTQRGGESRSHDTPGKAQNGQLQIKKLHLGLISAAAERERAREREREMELI